MATSIGGLFGLEDPAIGAQNRQNEQQRAFNQSLMYATDPRKFIAAVGGNMGAQLGAGAQSMLGGQTAEQVKYNQLNAAMQEISQQQYSKEWERMDALAKNLQSKGLYAEADKAAERARDMKVQDLNMKKAEKAMQPEPFKNISREVQNVDPNTGKVTVQTVTETMRWNPITETYEPMGRKASTGGEGGDGTPPPANDQQAKARAILEQRKAGGTYTNPVATARMPQGTPIPPDLRNQRGFQGQGMINPEGF